MKSLRETLKKIVKIHGGGCLLSLCSVSLLTIGFSSWIYTAVSSADFNVDVTVGNIRSADMFTVSSVNMFALGPDGMVKDEQIVTKSSIVANVSIDNSLAYDASNNGALNFEVVLSCSDSSFLSTYISKPTIENSTTLNSSISGNEIISDVSYTVSGNSELTSVVVNYTVNDKNKNMASQYYSNKPSFSFEIRSK